jgi:hypothetical protein
VLVAILHPEVVVLVKRVELSVSESWLFWDKNCKYKRKLSFCQDSKCKCKL